MAIDLSKLSALPASLIVTVQPYLPALQREGDELIDGFILHLSKKDWTAVDALMYKRMTPAERQALDQQVLAGAREAVQAQFDQIELSKELILKVLLELLIVLI